MPLYSAAISPLSSTNPTLRELVDKQIIERIIFLKKNREFYVEEQSERNDNKVCL